MVLNAVKTKGEDQMVLGVDPCVPSCVELKMMSLVLKWLESLGMTAAVLTETGVADR